MFDKIIAYSIQNKFVIGLFVLALIAWGTYSLRQLPIDAVPDITNNQVQIITTSPTLATEEIEQIITTPVELALQNIQQVVEMRSISRFGLSVVTVVFEEQMDLYLARQLVTEKLRAAEDMIPRELGSPELAPISTGLGEIYQYVVRPEEGFEAQYPLIELRSIQDWIVKRQLSGIKGVVEVNTLGGYSKQYEVAVQPNMLKSMNISITDIFNALESSNQNVGGAYIEKTPNTYYVRTQGVAKSLDDIGNIVVEVREGRPILVRDVAEVKFGRAPRYGALTRDGQEVVGGTVMMLKGENSADVINRIKERVTQIQQSLPEGVVIEPYLVREKLISMAIRTVKTNLIEGGLIVIFILVLMLGNWRAGLIVASVIPLAMLFAVAMMNLLGISANLMSLGAIDFGLIVDGAVIIVESIVHRLQVGFAGKKLSKAQMDGEVLNSSKKIRSSAAFGEIIILMVYIPILALVGIEGKMFRPMAQTVMLAITGALILSLTYVPMMAALCLNRKISIKKTWADKIIQFCQKLYQPVLSFAIRFKALCVFVTCAIFLYSLFIFSRMGGEFIPTLEEGDLALHQILPAGSSLSQSVEMSKMIQNKLLTEFPEVEDVVTKIGSSEIPTDPMPVETGDIIVIMKPKEEWTTAQSRKGMFEAMEAKLKDIPGLNYEFSQPIQMRFNELMTGSRADIAIKLFGEDLELIYRKAKEAEALIQSIDGVGTIKVEQIVGMPQIVVKYDYAKMAQYGLQVRTVNQVVRAAFAGDVAGTIYEGDKRFDLVVRLHESARQNLSSVDELYIMMDNGAQVPLNAIADVELIDAPMQISRDNTLRRIVIGVNVGSMDVGTLVKRIKSKLDNGMSLPVGYYFSYGGQFENLKAAKARLSIAVPVALLLIFILLYFTFGSISQALLIYTAIPLSAIGGIWALEMRGLPFSISAGIGFIALFGVAVLNGIVLIGYFNQLKKEGLTDCMDRIWKGTQVRLRPVLLTAAVASLGFLPMALSTSGGAEVQRPLATVVIGGLISATFLTLIILPILYYWLSTWQEKKLVRFGSNKIFYALLLLFSISAVLHGQRTEISLDEAVSKALAFRPEVQAADYTIQQYEQKANLKYQPGLSEIQYEGDGLFETDNLMVNEIAFIQQFEHPSKLKAKRSLAVEQRTLEEMDKQLTAATIRKNVSQIYFRTHYYKMLKMSVDSFINVQKTYVAKAKKRVKVGEANPLEELSLRQKLEELTFKNQQFSSEIQMLESKLATWIGEEGWTTKSHIDFLPTESTYASDSSLWSAFAMQKINVESARITSVQTQSTPDFNIGYAMQNYSQGGWYSGIKAGVQLSLFRKKIKQNIAVQELEVLRQTSQNRIFLLDQASQLEQAKVAIQQADEGVNFYQRQLAQIHAESIRISLLNYENGNLSYQFLLDAVQLKYEAIQNLHKANLKKNLTIAAFNYLSTQK